MRTYTDEQLVAYADGELPAAESAAIAQAAAGDPALARRIERFVQTRRVLSEAFAAKLAEPVPARLLEALAGPGKVVPLRRAAPRTWVPLALAASVALGVGLSVSLWLPRGSGATATTIAGLPPDAGALGAALERKASGEPAMLAQAGRNYEILPTATLQSGAGWCREFESRLEGATPARARGVACREADGQWRLVAAAAVGAVAATGGDYAPAGAAGPDLSAAIGAVVRVTPAQEQELIRDNWKTAPR